MICRVCGTEGLDWLDLGKPPLANHLLGPDEVPDRFPLAVARCPTCALSFTTEIIDPARLYTDYAYASGVSAGWVEHTMALARWVRRRHVARTMAALDIGANDGTLVRSLRDVGYHANGIDPSGTAEYQGYFPQDTASLPSHRLALLTATNVLGHVADVHAFIAECHRLLLPDGALCIEVPWVKRLLETAALDTIYHEHLSYWSMTALIRVLEAHDFGVIDAGLTPVHGGSLRVLALPHRGVRPDWADESALLTEVPYTEAESRYRQRAERLRELMRALQEQGRVAGFGAAAKGAALADVMGLTPSDVVYVVDETPAKQGKRTPYGVPIVEMDRLRTDPVEAVVVFPWNWLAEIATKLRAYRVRVLSAA